MEPFPIAFDPRELEANSDLMTGYEDSLRDVVDVAESYTHGRGGNNSVSQFVAVIASRLGMRSR